MSMSIVERARQAKAATEEKLSRGGGGFSRIQFWKPENGSNTVRLMPPYKGAAAGEFWREVAQHWNVSEDQKGPVLCPKKTPGLDGDCPICNFVQELQADKTDLEARKLAKDLRAKSAYLINLVDNRDPVYTAQDVAEFTTASPDTECPFEVGDVKVKVFAAGIMIFDSILGLISESGKDITDVSDKGRYIIIKKIPNKDRFKTRYEVYADLDMSSFDLGETKLPVLTEVGFLKSYEEMMELLSTGGHSAKKALPSGDKKALAAPKEEAPPATSGSAEQLAAEMRAALGD